MTRLRRPQIALILLLAALVIGYTVSAVRHDSSPTTKTTTATPTATAATSKSAAEKHSPAPLSSLPSEAAATVALIQHDGPFPYSQDGVVFNNNEKLLPEQPTGYYHEYTVPTPGSSDRGARRIIHGAGGEYYYTDDHYESFVAVDITS
ncbi:ribonuclease T1 [Jatrophihabitans sp. GAS493]|uniref:ribonuclease domain-containing protein n=1 Tax=Jatrophihabitans sp. GAS493 TaxID=1907575 RepID=UPI000BB79AF2|nr:ribonuclease domain-containing protein [Jatrophihabitans sp. GAS493]SOD74721.1 ribonuclease T1 [Jatrophihabitans sp. GAS493]